MKKFTAPVLFLATLALPAVVSAAAPKTFEGKVRFQITDGKKPMNMSYTVKGALIRNDMEMQGQTMSSIMDMNKREMIMLMPEQQMYMIMQMPDVTEAPEGTASKPDVQVELTDETETILGHKCKKLNVRSKEGLTEVWGAEGIGAFMMGGGGNPMARSAAPRHAWEAELAERGFFPLRLVTRDSAGKENFRMEAVEIDPASVPDSTFRPPADYSKFEMPAGLPGMPGGLNPFRGGN